MKNKIIIYLFFLFITLALYFLKVYLLGSKLDIFETDEYYYQWMGEIKDLPMSFASISKIYFSSLRFISAPEPISSYINYFIFLIFPELSEDLYLHILNVAYLITAFTLLIHGRLPILLTLFLILCLSIGYYEFTVMHSTHRFKIAVLLISIGMIVRTEYPKLLKVTFALACLTHFSVFAIMPVLWLLKKSGYFSIPSLPLFEIFIIGTVFIILILYSWYVGGADINELAEYSLIFIDNKLGHAGINAVFLLYMITAALFLMPISQYILRIIRNYVYVIVLLLYFIISLWIVGSSTLLFSFYIMLVPLLIGIYSDQSTQKKMNIKIFIYTIGLYSFYKGIILAPLPLYFDFNFML